MPSKELTDAEVFGAAPQQELSDAEVFGAQRLDQPPAFPAMPAHKSVYGARYDTGLKGAQDALSANAAAQAATPVGQDWQDFATQAPAGAIGGVLGLPGNVVQMGAGGLAAAGMPETADAIKNFPLAPPTSASIENFLAGEPATPQAQSYRSIGELAGPGVLAKTGSAALGYLAGAPPAKLVREMRSVGFKVTPKMASDTPTLTSKIVGGAGGKTAQWQLLSEHNSNRVNELAASDLGFPETKALTPLDIENVRTEAGKAYETLKKSIRYKMSVDHTLNKTIDNLGEAHTDGGVEFPSLIGTADIQHLKDSIRYVTDEKGNPLIDPTDGYKMLRSEISPGAAIDLVRTLRQQASAELKSRNSPKPFETAALAKARIQAADAIDSFMERTLPKKAAMDYRKARTQIAKSYDVESAMNSAGDVSARRIAAMRKVRPLSGGLKTIADAADAFPKVFQNPATFGGHEDLSVLDIIGAAASLPTRPGLAAMFLGRPLARATIATDAYQNAMVGAGRRPSPMLLPPTQAQAGMTAAGVPQPAMQFTPRSLALKLGPGAISGLNLQQGNQ